MSGTTWDEAGKINVPTTGIQPQVLIFSYQNNPNEHCYFRDAKGFKDLIVLSEGLSSFLVDPTAEDTTGRCFI